MDNKLNNMLNELFANAKPKDANEANKLLEEFLNKYNAGEIEYEDTPLDKAYEFLEKAKNAKTKKQALKLAKQAYDTSDECFDAIIFQSDLEENSLLRDKVLEDGLTNERKRLEKEGFFKADNIGHFYGIFETRPYIRGLCIKAHNLAQDGKTKQSIEVCKEILRLNENDNGGARYLLAALYAYIEDEEDLKKLYKKYTENNLDMLIPFFSLYYKQGNDKKAKEYLNKINEANRHFLEFFKGTLKGFDPGEYYSRGDESELMMYIKNYTFLLMSMPNLRDFILENSK